MPIKHGRKTAATPQETRDGKANKLKSNLRKKDEKRESNKERS